MKKNSVSKRAAARKKQPAPRREDFASVSVPEDPAPFRAEGVDGLWASGILINETHLKHMAEFSTGATEETDTFMFTRASLAHLISVITGEPTRIVKP